MNESAKLWARKAKNFYHPPSGEQVHAEWTAILDRRSKKANEGKVELLRAEEG